MPPSPKPLRQRQRVVEDLYIQCGLRIALPLPLLHFPAAAAAAVGLLLPLSFLHPNPQVLLQHPYRKIRCSRCPLHKVCSA